MGENELTQFTYAINVPPPTSTIFIDSQDVGANDLPLSSNRQPTNFSTPLTSPIEGKYVQFQSMQWYQTLYAHNRASSEIRGYWRSDPQHELPNDPALQTPFPLLAYFSQPYSSYNEFSSYAVVLEDSLNAGRRDVNNNLVLQDRLNGYGILPFLDGFYTNKIAAYLFVEYNSQLGGFSIRSGWIDWIFYTTMNEVKEVTFVVDLINPIPTPIPFAFSNCDWIQKSHFVHGFGVKNPATGNYVSRAMYNTAAGVQAYDETDSYFRPGQGTKPFIYNTTTRSDEMPILNYTPFVVLSCQELCRGRKIDTIRVSSSESVDNIIGIISLLGKESLNSRISIVQKQDIISSPIIELREGDQPANLTLQLYDAFGTNILSGTSLTNIFYFGTGPIISADFPILFPQRGIAGTKLVLSFLMLRFTNVAFFNANQGNNTNYNNQYGTTPYQSPTAITIPWDPSNIQERFLNTPIRPIITYTAPT